MSWEWIKQHMVEIIIVLVIIGIAIILSAKIIPSIDKSKNVANFENLCMKWFKTACDPVQYNSIEIDGTYLNAACNDMFPGLDTTTAQSKCSDICLKNYCNPLFGG